MKIAYSKFCSLVLGVVAFLAMSTGPLNAQITLEHTYNSLKVRCTPVKLNNGDVKIIVLNEPLNGTFQVYNSDHSLYKQVTIQKDTATQFLILSHCSDQLFNSDGKLEFAISKSWAASGGSFYSFGIYNEDGALLFAVDSARFNQIYKDDNGYKLMLDGLQINGITNKVQVYSLPGTLPLLAKEPLERNRELHDPFPNPLINGGTLSIPYTLPVESTSGELVFYDIQGSEIKRYTVTQAFSSLELKDPFPTGSYMYELRVNGTTLGTKKVVVVR